MADLTRYFPFRRSIDPWRDFDDAFRGVFSRPLGRAPVEFPANIALDVVEGEKSYTLRADLPGLAKEDIHVAIDGATVTISSEAKRAKEENPPRVLREERYVGKFYRSVMLDHEVDQTKAEAAYENGVLSLILPKKAGAEPRRIAIQ